MEENRRLVAERGPFKIHHQKDGYHVEKPDEKKGLTFQDLKELSNLLLEALQKERSPSEGGGATQFDDDRERV